jgi:hypothetical protein
MAEKPALDPRIDELLGRVTELSDDELSELRDLILAAFDGLAGETADPDAVVASAEIGALEAIAAAAAALDAEEKRRQNGRAAAKHARSAVANLRVPADRRPRADNAGTAMAITASGQNVHDRIALATELADTIRQNRAPNTSNGRVMVASIQSTGDYPKLPSSDPEAVERIMRDATSALVAAGGLGGNVEMIDYTLPGSESVRRPIQQALPRFTTERGGVRFMLNPQLADVDGAIGVWNLAMDVAAVAPDGPRKNILRIDATTEVVVDTEAVTSRLLVGNMMQRAYPELVARYVDLAAVAHARQCEQRLLASMDALSTQVTVTGTLGVSRVLLNTLERAAVQIRDRFRAEPTASVTVVLPAFAEAMLRSDLTLQQPGDGTVGVTSAQLAQYFSERNLTGSSPLSVVCRCKTRSSSWA